MMSEWIRMEHYRLHCAEQWPDSPYKRALVAAIARTLEGLQPLGSGNRAGSFCTVCANRCRVLQISASEQLPETARMAA